MTVPAPDPVEPARVDLAAAALFALLPPWLRTTDAQNGGALEAFMTVLAQGSAEIDAGIDRLYASQFVETAPEEALADFAALVAAEPLRPLPQGTAATARAYIANTIRYRRGKGTARVLEALATDVGGFAAVAVEYYQRLARLQHLADPRPERPALARLTPGDVRAEVGSAQDRLPRLAEVRAMARGGRFNVPDVGVHLLRGVVPFYAGPAGDTGILARQLDGVPVARPWQDGAAVLPGYFQLAAGAGRVLRLFNPDRRSQDEGTRPVASDLPDRLRRLPLHRETEELRVAIAEGRAPRLDAQPWFDGTGAPFAVFARRDGEATFFRVPPAQLRICNLEAMPASPGARPAASLEHTWGYDASADPPVRRATMPVGCGFDPVTGRMIFPAPEAGEPDIAEVRVAHGPGVGFPIGAGAQDRGGAGVSLDVTESATAMPFVVVVDGTASATTGNAALAYARVPSLADALALWDAAPSPAPDQPGLSGVIVLTRCDRHAGAALTVRVPTGASLTIVAGQWVPPASGPGVPQVAGRRGFIERVGRSFVIDAPVRVESVAAPGRPDPGVLAIDGVAFNSGLTLGAGALATLHLRHTTLRNPGGVALGSDGPPEGFSLLAERAILGRIAPVDGAASGGCRIALSDCVVSADEAAGEAIATAHFDGALTNVTVLGDAVFREIDATNTIFDGNITAARTQAGCLRYSWVTATANVPRRFRCQPGMALAAAIEANGGKDPGEDARAIVAFAAAPRFLDTALDEPMLAMLHARCSDAIRKGGEGETEMGAFALSAEGLRMENVTRFFDDYLPFGLEAALTDDTRSAVVAAQRNLP